jgi:hypothetical protein
LTIGDDAVEPRSAGAVLCLCKVAAPLVSAAHDQAGGFGAPLEPLRTSAPGLYASISASTATSTAARESTSASAVLTTSHWQPQSQATADAKQLRNEGAPALDFGVSATAASNSSKPVPTAGQAQATAGGGPSGAQMNVVPTLSSARATVPSPSTASAQTAALNSTEHDVQSSELEVPDGDDSEVELEAIVDVLPDQDGDSASDNDD